MLATGLPTITIIIPIRNEMPFFSQCFQAVLNQDYPSELIEVIIVDGMSTDGTQELVARLIRLYPGFHVRLLENRGRIVSTGMNIALAVSSGEIIVRVDGHTIIARDYVRQCARALDRSGADNVGGRMRPVGRGSFGKAVALATTSRFGIGGSRFHYSKREEFVDSVYLGAWRRSVFQSAGLFDEEQIRNQDDEFNYRICSLGRTILLSPRINSRYINRSSPRSLWRQYYQYGYWKVRVLQKHPRQMKPRHVAPSLLVLAFFALLFAAFVSPYAGWMLGLYISTYLLANVLASLVAARRSSLRTAAMIPLAFAILHTAYGTGFLLGLVRFWNRWADGSQQLPATSSVLGQEEPIGT
jgi:glycosyltransferase involved in cell wall biosynthesis